MVLHLTTCVHVGMDIKWECINAGLVRPSAHQHFKAPTSSNVTNAMLVDTSTANFEPNDFKDVLEFSELAEELIKEAAEGIDSDSDLDGDDDGPTPSMPVPAPPLTIQFPAHAIQAALPDSMPPQPVLKTAIPLKSLFIFLTNQDSPSTGLDSFWQGGIKNLAKEMEA
jgi:hypothetical protein